MSPVKRRWTPAAFLMTKFRDSPRSTCHLWKLSRGFAIFAAILLTVVWWKVIERNVDRSPYVAIYAGIDRKWECFKRTCKGKKESRNLGKFLKTDYFSMFVVQLLFPVEDFDNECLISVLSLYSLWLVFSMNLETGFRQRSKRIYIYILEYWCTVEAYLSSFYLWQFDELILQSLLIFFSSSIQLITFVSYLPFNPSICHFLLVHISCVHCIIEIEIEY